MPDSTPRGSPRAPSATARAMSCAAQDLDLDRAGGRQDHAARAHRAAKRRAARRRAQPVLRRPRPRGGGNSRDRQDGPQGGRLQRDPFRRHADSGRRPDRCRGRGVPLHPPKPQPGAHPGRRRGPSGSAATRSGGPRAMPASASCSAGRSAPIRGSSTRSPLPGRRWRRPISPP